MRGNGRPTAAERLYMDRLKAAGGLDKEHLTGLGMAPLCQEGGLYIEDPTHPKWMDPNHPSWAQMSEEEED